MTKTSTKMPRRQVTTGHSPQGGLIGDDGSTPVQVNGVESLKEIKSRQLYNDIGQAISRYHSVLGVRQREIKLADLNKGVLGVHGTGVADGKSKYVYLNKAYFKDATSKQVADDMRRMQKMGWQTDDNKPVAHVVTHELAHATWNAHMKAPEAKAAGKEIKKLYREFLADKTKKGHGMYAEHNVSEFFAETATRAIHGKADKYTTAIKEIVKKYKL